MPIKLDFNLISEIVSHGAGSNVDVTVDPSTSNVLSQAGVGMVTTYLEQLALLGIIRNPSPMFGADGGMWIGYTLTDRGLALSKSEQELRIAAADLTGNAKHEVSESVRELLRECERARINENYKEEFLRTLEEIATCFDEGCFIAAIGLCGKILEACLKEVLIRHNITFEPKLMVGQLIKAIKEKVPAEYVDPALSNIVDIINQSRITAVHAKEKIPIPSRDQAIMVIFATRDVVRRNLSHSSRGPY